MTNQEAIKVIALIGPTSTGKSAFSVKLAKKIGGEIISADSRQVYRGMNLGTGKITKKEMQGVRHHALDIASPRQASYNVSKFKVLALKLIPEIAKRRHIPIIAGGTGFWVDAVMLNLTLADVPPDLTLRKKLEKLSLAELFVRLQKLDSGRASTIDKQNPHRLIRAIEIAEYNKKSQDADNLPAADNLKEKKTPQQLPKISALYIGLDLPTEKLNELILKRFNQRLKQGMVKEVRKLHQQGVSWKTLNGFGLEYRFIADFLQKKITQEQMHELTHRAQKLYAKRQRTWFKRNKNIIWLNPEDKNSFKKALAITQDFLK